jgi:hypothetical protein
MVSNTNQPPCQHCLYILYFEFGPGVWGGGGEPEREGQRDISSQNWVENTTMTDCISTLQSLNSIKHQ